MADFNTAFRITVIANEGGYNPGIGEKETYRGIDRGANPNWSGWAIIDSLKTQKKGIGVKEINSLLAADLVFQSRIQSFYKANYWDVVKLDQVKDQQVANNLFDCSVNQGDYIARRFLQIACNHVITATHEDIKPLTVDGAIGPFTLLTLSALPPNLVMDEINDLRSARYKTTHNFDRWGEVWLKRLVHYSA